MWQKFDLKTHTDSRGSLTPLELKEYIDFDVRRIYTVHHNPSEQIRGGHAHIKEEELFILTAGACVAKLHDGQQWIEIPMQANREALYVGNMIWHQFEQFSVDGVLLALSSTNYNPDRSDYIEDLDTFLT